MAQPLFRPPKPTTLGENETITSFGKWRSNIEYNLSLSNEFEPYMTSQWSKKSVTNRGFVSDTAAENANANERKTALQKNLIVERMLGLVAQYAPSLLYHDIIKKGTSLSWVWDRIRKHYSFNKSEVNFLKLYTIHRVENERYETFFQRIISHLEDNLLTVDSGILHEGVVVAADEEMTPTCERLAVYLWLTLIDSRLPAYICRVYAHELKTKTLKDLQPQLADSMDSILQEINAQENIQIQYSRSSYTPQRRNQQPSPRSQPSTRTKLPFPDESSLKKCLLCKEAGRKYMGHNIKSCWFLSKFEKLGVARTFSVDISEDDIEDDELEEEKQVIQDIKYAPTIVRKVQCGMSPFFYAHYNHHSCHIIVDTGATSSLVSKTFLTLAGIKVQPTHQLARGIDKSPLGVQGEVKFNLNYGELDLPITALVIDKLDCDILAGIPFCKENDVVIHLKSEQISIRGQHIPYGAKTRVAYKVNDIFRAENLILRNDKKRVVLPGDFVELHSDSLDSYEGEVSVEPRPDSPSDGSWPQPHISRVIQGTIRIPNLTDEPVLLHKAQHFAHIRRVVTPENKEEALSEIMSTMSESVTETKHPNRESKSILYSQSVTVDPDNLCTEREKSLFVDINKEYDRAFDSNFEAYNDHSGVIRANINFGPTLPPPRKGKLPFYNQANLRLLQQEADKLEKQGVLAKPEEVGVHVQYVSPSFLVKKPLGGYRFVTAFNELSQYTRILPTVSSSCDEVLRKLSSWKFLIKTDLTKSFYQIRVNKASIPYLGTVTPFKGLRVYLRSAMGMPGSSEHLQELTSRIFGDLLQEGFVIILHDDFYICGNSVTELYQNWCKVLHRIHENNLKLSAEKTVICPRKTVILGWIWDRGTLRPSPHKIAPLAAVAAPKTCTSMRSFIGAFKAIARCIPKYASLVSPLEDAIKGMNGSQQIEWSDELNTSFKLVQKALSSPQTLTVPRSSDKLLMTVDASPTNKGLSATLFLIRDGRRLVAEFFSFKLKDYQVRWLPCEYEALAIATGVQHFAPYIRESEYPLVIYTDSEPCVKAYQNLKKGHFSASPRISSFLSTLSGHKVTVSHLKGEANQTSDFGSRNPVVCYDKTCQVCKFVEEVSTSVVQTVSVTDIISGSVNMPFLNPSAWIAAQHDCSQLRRTFAHLEQGTKPSRKARNLKDLRRYLQVATINDKGLLIVKKTDPMVHVRNLIIVPQFALPGLLTALHLYLGHPTKSQLCKVFERYFYALRRDVVIQQVTDSCDLCNSLKKLPKELFTQSSTQSPDNPGFLFTADVIRRSHQKIMVIRDVHSSFTTASLIPDETAPSLCSSLLLNTSLLRNASTTIHVDNALGFVALKDDKILSSKGVKLDYGRVKNKNKNAVADKAVQELELELLKLDPTGASVTQYQLQQAVDILNLRIRNRGLSAKEIILQRDQNSGEQLQFKDTELSKKQRLIRLHNQPHSARSKAFPSTKMSHQNIAVGDLVYIKSEGHKFKAREKYIVSQIEGDIAFLQKLSNGKFMSRRYEVPLQMLYLASQKGNDVVYHDWDYRRETSESSTDDEYNVEENSEADEESDRDDDHTEVLVEGEYEQQTDNTENAQSALGNGNNQPLRKSVRHRREPEWLTSGEWVRE